MELIKRKSGALAAGKLVSALVGAALASLMLVGPLQTAGFALETTTGPAPQAPASVPPASAPPASIPPASVPRASVPAAFAPAAGGPPSQTSVPPQDQAAGPKPGQYALALAATFGANGSAIRSGLLWRVFEAQTQATGEHKLVAQSGSAAPMVYLPRGDYLVHAAYGLAGSVRPVSVAGLGAVSERVPLEAGALRVVGMLGDARIPPARISLDIYAPQPGNSEATLLAKDLRPDQPIGLPEGLYHIVSTYLDTGSGTPGGSSRGTLTNSIVAGDFRVQTGKLTDVQLRHHAATLTLKLVNAHGGEALANTSFTVLTPGGDVIRELIGAFPSLVLAEGDYVVIARHDGKTSQSNFSVQSAANRDIEVLAK